MRTIHLRKLPLVFSFLKDFFEGEVYNGAKVEDELIIAMRKDLGLAK